MLRSRHRLQCLLFSEMGLAGRAGGLCFERISEAAGHSRPQGTTLSLSLSPDFLSLTFPLKVLEIRPSIKWDKGKALEYLLDSLGDYPSRKGNFFLHLKSNLNRCCSYQVLQTARMCCRCTSETTGPTRTLSRF